jgi:2,3-dihydroxybiphenyl 1,2-dioxygenase
MSIGTAYFGFEVSDLGAWERYAGLIGLSMERSDDGLFCRVDEKARRVHFVEGAADDIAWVGWDAGSQERFDHLRSHLGSLGIPTHDGDDASARLRGVEWFFHFVGPVGARHEIALGLEDAGSPFVSDKVPHGFVTGDQGLGHVAFNSTDHKGDEKFMREALFAQLSDYIYQPLPDGSTMHASFLHTSPRHHSIAFAEGLGGGSKLHHFELEMNKLEDVERAYERVQEAGIAIGLTLGQHSNDRIVSFYAHTPSKFMMEVGHGGLRIDDDESWEPMIHDRISEWGHEFQAV